MPPLLADLIHARGCKLKCEKFLTLPIFLLLHSPLRQRDTTHAKSGGFALNIYQILKEPAVYAAGSFGKFCLYHKNAVQATFHFSVCSRKKITKPATATEPGSRERSCNVCGYVMAEGIPATGGGDTTGTTSQPTSGNPNGERLSTIPQTGDSFRLEQVICLLCMSVASLVVFFCVWRRRYKT